MDDLLKQVECFMDNAANAFELADARNECIKFSGSYLEKNKVENYAKKFSTYC